VRDAAALIEIFDEVRERRPKGASAQVLRDVRRVLVERRDGSMRQAEAGRLASHTAATLRDAGSRVEAWPLEHDGFPAVRGGAKKIFRDAREAFHCADRHPVAVNFHEWRKRVKDHWYFVRLAENLWPEVMHGYRASLKTLEKLLGDDHNLVVLEDTLHADPDLHATRKRLQPFREAIEEYQKELREAAMIAGRRLYEEKPGEFTRRLEHLWELWQAERRPVNQLLEEQTPAAA
jgi:hypothetical protein